MLNIHLLFIICEAEILCYELLKAYGIVHGKINISLEEEGCGSHVPPLEPPHLKIAAPPLAALSNSAQHC